MSIRFDSDSRIFVLETAHTSYHMKVDALGHLLHLYYGKTIGTGNLMQLYPRTDRGFSPDYYAYPHPPGHFPGSAPAGVYRLQRGRFPSVLPDGG